MASEAITRNDLTEILDKVLPARDTGWRTLSTSSNTGTLQYRVVGNIAYVVGNSLTVTHNTVFCTLPAEIRPSIRITCSASFPINKGEYVNLFSNGELSGLQDGGGSIVNLYFTMIYPI